MEEKTSWLKKVAGIFVEVEGTSQSSGTAASNNTTSPLTTGSIAATPVSGDFVTDLSQRFKKIIDDKNQPGFDFYEFSQMLLRSSSNPSAEQFKTAFEGAKMLNPSCSKDFLVASANFYKNELAAAYQATVNTGQTKKSGIGSEKNAEKSNLEKEVQSIDNQLNKLKAEIQQLEASRQQKATALVNIDQKYNGILAEIEGKIEATAAAKEGVLGDILLIENGIRQYL